MDENRAAADTPHDDVLEEFGVIEGRESLPPDNEAQYGVFDIFLKSDNQ